MPRFLIEVPHEPDIQACARVIHTFLTSGSHFLTRADWGCEDGNHSAWMLVDVDSREDALAIVPPSLRPLARIIEMSRFTIDHIESILKGERL